MGTVVAIATVLSGGTVQCQSRDDERNRRRELHDDDDDDDDENETSLLHVSYDKKRRSRVRRREGTNETKRV
jgi:hypothetical protein